MPSPSAPSDHESRDHTPSWSLIASIALAAALGIAVAVSQEVRSFLSDAWNILTSGDQHRIHEWTADFGMWGPLVIVFLMILQIFLIVAPSWLLMVVAVLAYGPWWGGLVAVVAVAAAASVGYGVGRLVGEHGLESWVSAKTLQKVERETERYGVWAVLITRINPLLSNDAISLVAGVIRMGFWRFLASTIAGILPLAGAIAAFGGDWKQMKTTMIWISVASLAGLVVKIIADRRKS